MQKIIDEFKLHIDLAVEAGTWCEVLVILKFQG